MKTHLLSHALRTCGQYTARCSCGLDCWGRSLPSLWAAHQLHLEVARAMKGHL